MYETSKSTIESFIFITNQPIHEFFNGDLFHLENFMSINNGIVMNEYEQHMIFDESLRHMFFFQNKNYLQFI